MTLVFVIWAAFGSAGCMHSSTTGEAGSENGSTFENLDDETRETVLISPAEAEAASFDVRPAVFDTALIRVVVPTGEAAIIEVALKGAFSDGCYELHELDQEPMRGGQRVSLRMRRPHDAICTQVMRPYRFFFTLDRRFDPGSYVLTMNDRTFPFHVTAR